MKRYQRRADQARSTMRQVRRPFGRIAAFGVLPAISILSNLVVLPLVSARFGQAGWSSVLLGQSLGAAASVVCALTWPVEGSRSASRAHPAERLRLYNTSVKQRLAAVAAVSPVLFLVCLLVKPSMLLVCVLCAIGTTLNALSPGWYFVGVSRPSWSLLAEGAPRLTVNIAAVGLVAFLPLWTYPAALIVGMIATLGAASALVRRDARVDTAVLSDSSNSTSKPTEENNRLLALFARGADAGYSYMTGPLIAAVAAPAYPLYAAIDRVSHVFVNAMAPITQGLTAWIAEGGAGVHRRRLLGALVLASTLAGVALVAISLVITPLLDYLFDGTVDIDTSVAMLAGVIVSGTFLSRSLALIFLVPQDLARSAYGLIFSGAGVGLPLVVLAAVLHGSTAALVAAAIVPWVVVAAQVKIGLSRLRVPSTVA